MRPPASSPDVRRRMQAVRRRDTVLEMRLRSALHRMGFRYPKLASRSRWGNRLLEANRIPSRRLRESSE